MGVMPASLPIYDAKEEFCRALREKGAVVLTAPTGSGKSTQIPRILLTEVPGRILVLQPRRLAARMLAERVAFECGEKTGKLVGFQTRYEKSLSAETRILFVTEGILTRMLLATPELPGISCVVFDEFHERSLNTDLGLAMVWHSRNTIRPDLKLVVMSATMDPAPIQKFLDDAPVVTSSGRLHPVDIRYCDQKRKMQGPAVAAALSLRDLLREGAEGDVLIFMPGGYEIRKTIEACSQYDIGEKIDFLPLYGDLPPAEQHRVMEPTRNRKVIVATNIAETSLTIPGVRHVIDSGLAKINRYDAVRGVDALQTEPIARDASDQRAGRAGREGPGICLRLWTWLEQSAKTSRTLPEIHRVDLAEAVLAVAAFGFANPNDFPWFEKPPQKMLDGARTLLEKLEFLATDGSGLTPLGRQLSQVPAHPRLALLMWFGAEHGCFAETAWAAALLNERSLIPPSASTRKENTARRQESRQSSRASALPSSDFLVQISLAQAAMEAHFSSDYCDRMGIHPGAARDIARAAKDYEAMGRRLGWNDAQAELPEREFLQCILRAFPDRLARRIDSGTLVCLMADGRRCELSPSSVVRDSPLLIAAEMREVSGGGMPGVKTQLSLCSGIQEEWLLDLFPERWEESDETLWDDRKQQVVRHQTLSCLGVLLEDKLRSDLDPEKAAEILAEQLIDGKAPIPNWDEDVQHWIDRVSWIAALYPEEELPAYDNKGKAEILRQLCMGESSLKRLKNKETLSYVKNLLSWKQQQFVEQMAPPFLRLPNGRKMKLHYTPGQPAKGSAKIYDLYDLPDLPVIAGGRARVLLDILAPNFRTVQITDDLANFWKVLYPKVKPELARRYPKHPWR